MGRLFEEEFCVISGLMEKPDRPCVFVLGGAKINDAFMMMDTVLKGGVADRVLAGGLVAEVLLWAAGSDIGEPARAFIKKEGYDGLVTPAKEILARYGDKIDCPTDFGYVQEGRRREARLGDLPAEALPVDIGTETAERFRQAILEAKTVFVNGPMGVFEEEPSELGTRTIWEALGATKAYTVIGGGDSITATNKYGQTEKIDYICTGGGALIRFLSGEELPVVKALRHGATLEAKV
jgi:phosphoglycerate kinase